MRIDLLQNIARATRETLGEPLFYLASSGRTVEVCGVFQEVTTTTDVKGGAGILTVAPTVTIASADLPVAPTPKDRVSVRGVVYRVVDKIECGKMIRFSLQEC